MNFSLGDEVKDHAKAQDRNILILNKYHNITISYS